jgi:hypothetical protein
MASLSARTAGRSDVTTAQVWDSEGLRSGVSRWALRPWMLLIAALLWPIAVMLSRLLLRRSLGGDVATAPGGTRLSASGSPSLSSVLQRTGDRFSRPRPSRAGNSGTHNRSQTSVGSAAAKSPSIGPPVAPPPPPPPPPPVVEPEPDEGSTVDRLLARKRDRPK